MRLRIVKQPSTCIHVGKWPPADPHSLVDTHKSHSPIHCPLTGMLQRVCMYASEHDESLPAHRHLEELVHHLEASAVTQSIPGLA